MTSGLIFETRIIISSDTCWFCRRAMRRGEADYHAKIETKLRAFCVPCGDAYMDAIREAGGDVRVVAET